MIIIYDLLTDQKVNLMGHKHNVYALSFTPNGEQLMSIDFNRDAELYNSNLMTYEGDIPELPSCIFLWNWKKGECIQTKYIPRDSSINEALILNQAVSI
jgi:WD40 repeat protein